MKPSMFNMNVKIPSASEVDPDRFYGLVDIIKNVDKEHYKQSEEFIALTKDIVSKLDDQVEALSKANNNMLQELRISSRFKGVDLKNLDDEIFEKTLGNKNFLRVAFNVTSSLASYIKELVDIAKQLRPRPILVSKDKFDGSIDDLERLMAYQVETQINQPNIDRFVDAILRLNSIMNSIYLSVGNNIYYTLEEYYRTLAHRHSIEGVKIQQSPILTDIAISIFDNVDSHGEIQDGKNPDKVSAYSIRKAQILADALKSEALLEIIDEPSSFMKFIKNQIELIWRSGEKLRNIFKEEYKSIIEHLDIHDKKLFTNDSLSVLLNQIDDVDPLNVSYRESDKLLSSDEKFSMNFRNESLREIVFLLQDGASTANLIKYVLDRKKELKKYYQNENSFYVCKTSAGNPFTGEVPGELMVIPGERPNINMDEILGSGFSEVNNFISQIEASSKFHDIFVATSPSKSADKSNILLVGPQGSGKTEVLRAVGGNKDSLGIFAQGSDFLTCWKGEAEKNPKRLFEAAIRLQKESNKQVHILIDEIDSVLKKKELTSKDDFGLTLEFQILMDGVVRYPNLSVWGATNSPQNIPMPMIRRFNKVLIVGELDERDRADLLQQFVGCLPLSNKFSKAVWKELGNKLNGATGDVIRKVADHIWREKMTSFVKSDNEKALELVSWLNENEKFNISNFDPNKRAEFKSKLGKTAKVSPKDVEKSINIHLKNIAIRNEIDTAVETYNNARNFLEQLGDNDV